MNLLIKLTKQVEHVYLGSQFMGHGAANNIMDDFKKVHKELDIANNLVQLSVDGPNIVWAFLDTVRRKTQMEGSFFFLLSSSCFKYRRLWASYIAWCLKNRTQ